MEITVTDIVIIVVFALLFAVLDKKVTWLRMGKLYRANFWQDFLVNLLVVGALYFLVGYFL